MYKIRNIRNILNTFLNLIQDGLFCGCSKMGVLKDLLNLTSVTPIPQYWITYTLPKEDPKNIKATQCTP